MPTMHTPEGPLDRDHPTTTTTPGTMVVTRSGIPGRVTHPGPRGFPGRVYVHHPAAPGCPGFTTHYHPEELWIA